MLPKLIYGVLRMNFARITLLSLSLLGLNLIIGLEATAQTPPHVVNVRYDITVGASQLEIYEALEISNFPTVVPYWVNAQVNTTSQTCNVIDLDQLFNLGQAVSSYCSGSGNSYQAHYLKWNGQQLIPFVKRIECVDSNDVYFSNTAETFLYGSGTYTLLPFGFLQPFPSYC